MNDKDIKNYQEWFLGIKQVKETLKNIKPHGNTHVEELLDCYINELQKNCEDLQQCIETDLINGQLSTKNRCILEKLAFEIDNYPI